MAHAPAVEPLPTFPAGPDELWNIVQPILKRRDPRRATGRPRIDSRAALDAIIHRMRTGCRWNHLPTSLPDDSGFNSTSKLLKASKKSIASGRR